MILDYLWRYPPYIILLIMVDLVTVSYPPVFLIPRSIRYVFSSEVRTMPPLRVSSWTQLLVPSGTVLPLLRASCSTGKKAAMSTGAILPTSASNSNRFITRRRVRRSTTLPAPPLIQLSSRPCTRTVLLPPATRTA